MARVIICIIICNGPKVDGVNKVIHYITSFSRRFYPKQLTKRGTIEPRHPTAKNRWCQPKQASRQPKKIKCRHTSAIKTEHNLLNTVSRMIYFLFVFKNWQDRTESKCYQKVIVSNVDKRGKSLDVSWKWPRMWIHKPTSKFFYAFDAKYTVNKTSKVIERNQKEFIYR